MKFIKTLTIKMNQAVNKILFITFISAVFIKINEGAELNNKEIDSELQYILDNYPNGSNGKNEISFSCQELNCTGCLNFAADQDFHEICLTGGLKPQVLGVYALLNFDNSNIWKKEIDFDSVCYELAAPMEGVNLCLDLYDVRMNLPEEAAVCFRTELSLIYPLVTFNITCINYEKGKGIWFGRAIQNKSNALINIYMNDGKLKLRFNKKIPFIYLHRIIDLLKYQSKEIEFGATEKNLWNQF